MNVNEEEVKEVFRGHFKECLQHLAVSLKEGNSNAQIKGTPAVKLIADFCGVKTDVASRWLEQETAPIGEQLIKLHFCLDLIGYKVIELERMEDTLRKFSELIGFGVVSLAKAKDIFGFTKSSTLSRIILGQHDNSEENRQKMWDFWKEKKNELELKKTQVRTICRQEVTAVKAEQPAIEADNSMPGPAQLPAADLIEPVQVPNFHQAGTGILSMMRGLALLLDTGALDNLSDDALVALNFSADNAISRLANQLSELNSRLNMIGKGGN